MTADGVAQLRDLATHFARGLLSSFLALQTEGAGKTGCALHPRSHVQLCEKGAHEHTGPAESIRPSLRNGFTAYAVISPATNSLLSPSLANMVCLNPVGSTRLHQLDISNGCRNHTVLPYAATSFVCVLLIAHEQARPAITFHARRCRVHRNPSRVRDAGQRPSGWDGMRLDIVLIWGVAKRNIFGKSENMI